VEKPRIVSVGSKNGRYDFHISERGYMTVHFASGSRDASLAEEALVLEVESLRVSRLS
jgi:hypothetical protein